MLCHLPHTSETLEFTSDLPQIRPKNIYELYQLFYHESPFTKLLRNFYQIFTKLLRSFYEVFYIRQKISSCKSVDLTACGGCVVSPPRKILFDVKDPALPRSWENFKNEFPMRFEQMQTLQGATDPTETVNKPFKEYLQMCLLWSGVRWKIENRPNESRSIKIEYRWKVASVEMVGSVLPWWICRGSEGRFHTESEGVGRWLPWCWDSHFQTRFSARIRANPRQTESDRVNGSHRIEFSTDLCKPLHPSTEHREPSKHKPNCTEWEQRRILRGVLKSESWGPEAVTVQEVEALTLNPSASSDII